MKNLEQTVSLGLERVLDRIEAKIFICSVKILMLVSTNLEVGKNY